MTITRYKPDSRMSTAVVHGDTIYMKGHVAPDDSKDIKGQTSDILAQIEAELAELGSDKSKILSATIHLAHVGDRDGLNAVWDAWVDPENAPVRTATTCTLGRPTFRIEISMIAAK